MARKETITLTITQTIKTSVRIEKVDTDTTKNTAPAATVTVNVVETGAES